ncbi:MAG: methyltransferase domain-containing protein [Anaerolineae bacterium]|nr:methyltransferase domain-containing protein [Anaerolineae bacterium]
MSMHGLKRAYQRFRPNSSRVWLRRFLRRCRSTLPTQARILDAGAGEAPYAGLFAGLRYHATDRKPLSPKLNYVCDLAALPCRDQIYDVVICTQVLEHVREPKQVLAELSRVLKPGGQLWLTAPFFFAEHMHPYDYYRYTRYGLIYLLEQAGLETLQVEPLEGYLGTLAYECETAARHFPLRPREWSNPVAWLVALSALVVKPVCSLAYLLLSAADVAYKVNGGYCKNYAVIARKPGGLEHKRASALGSGVEK